MMKRAAKHSGRRRTGFTLVEALLALMLLGIASASLLLPFTAGATIRKDGLARTMAASLASQQMEKVLGTPFSQIVSTWNNTTEAAGTLTDAQGNALSGHMYSQMARSITCSPVYASQQSGTLAPCLINVTVTVTYRGAALVSLSRLVAE
jgi:prepilin-type N-terminal cleavage/methylation domain-containing protein